MSMTLNTKSQLISVQSHLFPDGHFFKRINVHELDGPSAFPVYH